MTKIEEIHERMYGGEIRKHLGYVKDCDYLGEWQFLIGNLSVIETIKYNDHVGDKLVLEVWDKDSQSSEQFDDIHTCIEHIQELLKHTTNL